MKLIKIFMYLSKPKALSETLWQARKSNFEKLKDIYQYEINSSDGIFGIKILIDIHFFDQETKFNIENIIEKLCPKNDYSIYICEAGISNLNEIFKKVDFKNFLYFSGNSNVKPMNGQEPYFFQISRVAKQTKVDSAKFYIKNDFKGKKIFFLHEGERFRKELLPLLKSLDKPFFEYDLSKIGASEYDKHINPLLKNISKGDLLILSVGALKLLHIVKFLNLKKIQPTVLKLFGIIDGRIDKYNFPIIEISSERSNNSLSFESLCNKLSKNISKVNKDFIASDIYKLETVLLIAYASRKYNRKINNKNDFFSAVKENINKIDGINDVFIGKANQYSFQNSINTNKTSFNYLIPNSLQKKGEIERIYYPIQFFPLKNKIMKIDVNYAYIDIIRITNVDIGESIWSCEFFLDIVSKHKNPLDIFNFNNLSLINSKFETKLVEQSKDILFNVTNYRYYIVANFDFLAIADNYPFDWQHIYISMSMVNQEKYGIIQPIPEILMDKEFQLDGWKLMDAKSGILRKKEMQNKNVTLEQGLKIREEIRVGWTIARTNVVTTMKVVIPIIFLTCLNYYTFFLSYEETSSSIGILTTTFLSGIALYFSTEKPQPLRMTTIDLIFIYYYLQVGLSIVITAITSFTDKILYDNFMIAMQFILPLSMILALVLLFKRIKSVRLKPRIDA